MRIKFYYKGVYKMKKYSSFNFLSKEVNFDEIDSPIGILTIITSLRGLHALLWDNPLINIQDELITRNITRAGSTEMSLKVQKQLNEYFIGERQTFDLPLVMHGTDFQIKAWNELTKIPYATTVSYKEQAQKIGDINKARAVGMANGRNHIGIIIPCHRVIGSNGKLVGFAGGVERKEWLLHHEKTNMK